MRSSTTARQSLRWLSVGAATATVDATVFTALYRLSVPLVPANVLSSGSGLLFGYWAHRRWSFAHDGAHKTALPRFVTTYLVNLVLNTGATGIALHWLHLAPFLAKIAALTVQTPMSYLLMHQWVFSNGTRRVESPEEQGHA